jgi:hypothetical protein
MSAIPTAMLPAYLGGNPMVTDPVAAAGTNPTAAGLVQAASKQPGMDLMSALGLIGLNAGNGALQGLLNKKGGGNAQGLDPMSMMMLMKMMQQQGMQGGAPGARTGGTIGTLGRMK